MATATITGKTGAGITMTAQVLNDVRSFCINNDSKILELTGRSGEITQVSVAAATVMTVVVNTTGFNITIS